MNSIGQEAKDELEYIRKRHGGFLRPVDIVAYARKPKTILHKYFEWDDTEAAARYRLHQAKEIIRVVVHINEETSEKVRTFVSLSSDRNHKLGYRALVDVMDDADLTATLISDAKLELEYFARKYDKIKTIAELSGVFTEIEKVVKTKKRKSVTSAKEARVTA